MVEESLKQEAERKSTRETAKRQKVDRVKEFDARKVPTQANGATRNLAYPHSIPMNGHPSTILSDSLRLGNPPPPNRPGIAAAPIAYILPPGFPLSQLNLSNLSALPSSAHLPPRNPIFGDAALLDRNARIQLYAPTVRNVLQQHQSHTPHELLDERRRGLETVPAGAHSHIHTVLSQHITLPQLSQYPIQVSIRACPPVSFSDTPVLRQDEVSVEARRHVPANDRDCRFQSDQERR